VTGIEPGSAEFFSFYNLPSLAAEAFAKWMRSQGYLNNPNISRAEATALASVFSAGFTSGFTSGVFRGSSRYN
jgi:hypothetical protein